MLGGVVFGIRLGASVDAACWIERRTVEGGSLWLLRRDSQLRISCLESINGKRSYVLV